MVAGYQSLIISLNFWKKQTKKSLKIIKLERNLHRPEQNSRREGLEFTLESCAWNLLKQVGVNLLSDKLEFCHNAASA